MNEQQYYAQLYQLADADRDGKVSGQEGALFLRKSQLNDMTLMQIWNLADQQKQGFLNFTEFVIALKLVTMAQQGILPALERVSQVTTPPQLVGVVVQLPQQAAALTPDELYKYDNLFLQADRNKDGLVDGEEAKVYFAKANIQMDKLAKIWGLCERDHDNCLNVSEFRLAIHLVYSSLKGAAIPEELSKALIEASQAPSQVPEVQQHLARRSNTSTPTTTSNNTYQAPPPQVNVTINANPQMTKPMAPTQFHNQLNQTLHTQMTSPAPAHTQPPQQKSIFDEKFEFPVTFDTAFPEPSKEPQRLQQYDVAHKHNYDQSPYVHHHTLPGATFEQRANFTSELSAAIASKSKKGSES